LYGLPYRAIVVVKSQGLGVGVALVELNLSLEGRNLDVGLIVHHDRGKLNVWVAWSKSSRF